MVEVFGGRASRGDGGVFALGRILLWLQAYGIVCEFREHWYLMLLVRQPGPSTQAPIFRTIQQTCVRIMLNIDIIIPGHRQHRQ